MLAVSLPGSPPVEEPASKRRESRVRTVEQSTGARRSIPAKSTVSTPPRAARSTSYSASLAFARPPSASPPSPCTTIAPGPWIPRGARLPCSAAPSKAYLRLNTTSTSSCQLANRLNCAMLSSWNTFIPCASDTASRAAAFSASSAAPPPPVLEYIAAIRLYRSITLAMKAGTSITEQPRSLVARTPPSAMDALLISSSCSCISSSMRRTSPSVMLCGSVSGYTISSSTSSMRARRCSKSVKPPALPMSDTLLAALGSNSSPRMSWALSACAYSAASATCSSRAKSCSIQARACSDAILAGADSGNGPHSTLSSCGPANMHQGGERSTARIPIRVCSLAASRYSSSRTCS
mmetsp:Transcript_9275/g.16714  ORF Transcript_9275/g.16714 Transcript_9275/m.16714 type:complete len:350 (+) Transcript_9275:1898-2947(+)